MRRSRTVLSSILLSRSQVIIDCCGSEEDQAENLKREAGHHDIVACGRVAVVLGCDRRKTTASSWGRAEEISSGSCVTIMKPATDRRTLQTKRNKITAYEDVCILFRCEPRKRFPVEDHTIGRLISWVPCNHSRKHIWHSHPREAEIDCCREERRSKGKQTYLQKESSQKKSACLSPGWIR